MKLLTTLWQYAARIPATVLILLSVALAATVVTQGAELNASRKSNAAAALAVVNAEATLDSTRNIAAANKRVAQLLGDSLSLVEKRVVQVKQQRDALDVALRRERRASYAVNVAIDSLRTITVAAPSVANDTSGDVRRATIDVRQPPYTIAAEVEMPAPPDSARISLAVTLDTIPIRARITCQPPDARGARTAAIVAQSPPWAHVQFGQVEQAPEICNAPRAAAHHIAFKPLSVGVGRAAVWGGPTGWALFVGAVLTVN